MIKILPIDSIGVLLNHNSRYEDIDKWGKYIFNNFNPKSMNEFNVDKVLRLYRNQNKIDFEKNAINYLIKVNQDMENGGRHFFSFRTFENSLITLLIPLNFEMAIEFYNKTKDSQYISNSFI